MLSYTATVSRRVIYSLGDTHGRGRDQLSFIEKIRDSRPAGEDYAFVQLGDLCDGFAFSAGGCPIDAQDGDAFIDALCGEIDAVGRSVPDLADVLAGDLPLVNWRKHADDRDGDVVGAYPAKALIARRRREEIIALCEACKSFETLALYCAYQQAHPDSFYVVLGNHDADLLLGKSRYGRQQKYLLLGLLGFSPQDVIDHMTEGRGNLSKRHPYLSWLGERPHLALSSDTVYMHGGPTADLSDALSKSGKRGFEAWLEHIDGARKRGLSEPDFWEHQSFLSPDGADNDWTNHPERLAQFLDAAGRRFAAVGHSPFLDFAKGEQIDLEQSQYGELFETPAQLPPDNRLIKHDTNLKRGGRLWACRHEVGASDWTGIDSSLDMRALRTRIE